MLIDVHQDLIAWYPRRGYRCTGEYAPFPYGDKRSGTPVHKDLRFKSLLKALPPEPMA